MSERKIVLLEPSASTSPADIIKTAKDVSDHLSNNPPLDEGLRSRLSEEGWVPGENTTEKTWSCRSCDKVRTGQDALCSDPLCKGVNKAHITDHLRKSGFDYFRVDTRDWPAVFKEVSKNKIEFLDS